MFEIDFMRNAEAGDEKQNTETGDSHASPWMLAFYLIVAKN
jgi:hypothetical protein